MRIGFLIYGDMDAVSGGYLYNRQLIAYLRSQGEEVVIISLPLRNYWRHFSDNFRSACVAQIRAAKLDILIQDEWVHPSLVWLNRRLAGLPLVTLVHLFTAFDAHPWYSAWFYRAVERRYLQSVQGLIANSQTTLTQARALIGDKLPAYCVAKPAGDHFPEINIELDALRQRSFAAGPLRILVVGNLIKRKGLHVLIKALSLLPSSDFRVSVAGRLDMEPAYAREIADLIQHAGLTASVTFLGVVQDAALAALYLQHQLMVLPSAFESFGIVYLEAQQFGLPVIGTTAGAAWEVITHGENGYLVTPEDADELAALLLNLRQDRELLLRLSCQARAAFAAQPGWAQCGETVLKFLRGGVVAKNS
jgi:glycosyltransferase involved in cell wall biosynthesis